MLRVLRTVIAVVIGYAVMVILITLVQETWLGGVSYRESPRSVLAMAGFFTFLSAAIGGGAVGTWLSGSAKLVAGFVMAGLTDAGRPSEHHARSRVINCRRSPESVPSMTLTASTRPIRRMADCQHIASSSCRRRGATSPR